MASKPPPSKMAKEKYGLGCPNYEEEDTAEATGSNTIRPSLLSSLDPATLVAGQQLARHAVGQQQNFVLGLAGVWNNNRSADWGRPSSAVAPVNAQNTGDASTLVRGGLSFVGNSIPRTFPPSATAAASLPGLINNRNPEVPTAAGGSMTLGSSSGLSRAYSSNAAHATSTDRNAVLQQLLLQQKGTQEDQVQPTASTPDEILLLSQIQGLQPSMNVSAGCEDARQTHQFIGDAVTGQDQMLIQQLVAVLRAQSDLRRMTSTTHHQQHPATQHLSSLAAGMPRLQNQLPPRHGLLQNPATTTVHSSITGAVGAISDVVSSNAPATTVARLKSRSANREETLPTVSTVVEEGVTSNARLTRSDVSNNSSIRAKRPATAISHVGPYYDGQYKPKRALSAYNLFFKHERARLLEQEEVQRLCPQQSNQPRRRSSFEEMGREIGRRWQQIDPQRKIQFQGLAAEDKSRYEQQLALYNERKLKEIEAKFQQREATVTEETRRQYLESEGASLLRKRKKTKSNKEGKGSGGSKNRSKESKSK